MFTDIEGSTQRWERYGEAMRDAVARHDSVLKRVFREHRGYVFKSLGDAFCVAFHSVGDAAGAAVDAQTALSAMDWSNVDGLAIRIAIHAGTTDERDGDYFGPVVNRVARLMSVAHGGQIVLSAAARYLTEGSLPTDASLVDLGSHRLKDLSQPEAVAQLSVRGLRSEFPPLRSLDSARTNLPVQFAPLIGREREVEQIATLVRTKPLVSLVGAGGIGKTRIATQAGADLLAEFADGVWFIDLAPITEPALVAGMLAATFGVPDVGLSNVMERVVASLASRQLLLILDNCEQVVAAAASVVTTILRGCAGVRILATTREALHVSGEEVYRVSTLPVPPATAGLTAQAALKFSAIELFVARISTLAPFTLTDENAPVVADICTRLDGIALAIELAASRVKVLSPRQVSQRLDERFRILTGGSRTALPRQQTLRALIDWSHDLLDERERIVFRRTGIFAASFDLNAAITVCSDEDIDEWDVVDVLDALVDKSLISVEPIGEERRYRLLESMRAYAREQFRQSGEEERTRLRWSDYYRTLAATRISEHRTQVENDVLVALEIENDNFRSVLEWAIAAGNDPVGGLEFAATLSDYWGRNGLQSEGFLWLQAGLRLVDENAAKSTVAKAWLAVASLGQNTLLGKRALDAAVRAVEFGRESNVPAVVARGYLYAGWAYGRLGDYAQADEAYASALERLRAIGDQRGVLHCLISQAGIATLRNREEIARDLYGQVLTIQGDSRPTHSITAVTGNLALLEFSCGNRSRALELGRQAVEQSRGLNDRALLASLLVNLTAFLVEDAQYDEAACAALEALQLSNEWKYSIPLCIAIEHIALLAALRGAHAESARLIGFTQEAMEAAGFVRELTERRGYDRLWALLSDTLGEAVFAQVRLEGRVMSEDFAIGLARRLAAEVKPGVT